jgi:hypothetical protein
MAENSLIRAKKINPAPIYDPQRRADAQNKDTKNPSENQATTDRPA